MATVCLFCQTSQCGPRQTFQPGQNDLKLTVLFGGGLVERGCVGAEPDVDGLALGFVGPFEVRAVTFGGIVVAGALRLAALHHPLQDGSLQEIVQLPELSLRLPEGLGGSAEG